MSPFVWNDLKLRQQSEISDHKERINSMFSRTPPLQFAKFKLLILRSNYIPWFANCWCYSLKHNPEITLLCQLDWKQPLSQNRSHLWFSYFGNICNYHEENKQEHLRSLTRRERAWGTSVDRHPTFYPPQPRLPRKGWEVPEQTISFISPHLILLDHSCS